MKTKDLRIGNYLLDNQNRLCQVEDIHIHGFAAPAINGPMTSMPNKPIPLSEDYAVKLGFEKREIKWQDNSVSENAYVKFKYLLSFTKDGVALSRFMTPGNSKIEPIYIASIETVHHLQNLWQALTGEDLTINSPRQATEAKPLL